MTKNTIKIGTVIVGNKSGGIHNEIVRIYTENNKRMIEVEQYRATLVNKDHNKTVVFFEKEIFSMLRKGLAHVVLAI